MTKRLRRKYGTSRRLGVNLWGRGKDPVEKKNYPPGMHSVKGYSKLTDFGIQLNAKQKLRKYYGDVTEKQFRKTYQEAVRRKGDTGENLIGLLESRLDAFIYRSNFVPTIFSARQFVNHKHVKVNGKIVNIPSYRLKPGDVVEIKDSSKQLQIVQEAAQSSDKGIPEYILADHGKMTAQYVRIPVLADVPYPVAMEPSLVIEYYSR